MTLHDSIDYLSNPSAPTKTRVVLAPWGNMTDLRQFFHKRLHAEIRMSALISEKAWLPSLEEVLGRVHESGILLGLDGYLALLDEANRHRAIEAIRRFMDNATVPNVVFLLENSVSNCKLIRDVFDNPRYRESKQIIDILPRRDETAETLRPEILLVGDEWKSSLPYDCETFQSFLRKTEEHPCDSMTSRIIVQSDGLKLPGVSVDVRQVMNLRDIAKVFYGIDDVWLSDAAIRWLIGHGKEEPSTLAKTVLHSLFPKGEMNKAVLRVFSEKLGVEREAVLWMARKTAQERSYLGRVVHQTEVTTENFLSAYVGGCLAIEAILAAETASKASFADERREAICALGVQRSEADIQQFIESVKGETTAKVAPWLNCGTGVERAELLRRCTVDGIVSNAIKDVYPEVKAYLDDVATDAYFKEYRELKLTDRLTDAFYEKAKMCSEEKADSRESHLQKYFSDDSCALLVVDAMGAEWMPMILNLARMRSLAVESAEIGESSLPTATNFNPIAWPKERRLPDIKRFDNIAHNGAEAHEMKRAEENMLEQLDVIGSSVFPKVTEALTRFERVVVTADHGSSRLAVLAWHLKLARTLETPSGAEILDWRYCRKGRDVCPSELEESVDGKFWIVRGYDRLSKSGGGSCFERHGGATLEERMVPVIVFTRKGTFSLPKTTGKPVEFIENNDFDL